MRAAEGALSRGHRLYAHRFQRVVLRQLVPLQQAAAISRQVDAAVERLLAKQGVMTGDEEGEKEEASDLVFCGDDAEAANLRLAVTVEHAYRASGGSVEAVKQAVRKAGKPLVTLSVFSPLSRSIPTLAAQVSLCNRCLMGGSFSASLSRPNDFTLRFSVRKCFFFSYFSAVNAPFLTSVFCALDNEFGAKLPPSKFRYTRPSTIASGGKSCEFVIERAISNDRTEKIKLDRAALV